MILTIDVGNTNISCGVFRGDELISKFRFITDQLRTSDELALQIHSILEVRDILESEVTDVVLSSVVPNLNTDLVLAIKTLFNVEPLMINSKTYTGLEICIADPNSCGADLIVDALAGYEKYKGECIVVDFGTATKFLYVNDKCQFHYGIIAPGLEIYANSLWQKTAQLPAVQLVKPDSILTNDTVSCMQAGIMYGYIGLTEGIINQIKKEIGRDIPILATGGLGRYIVPETNLISEYDPDLAYKGMKLIWERNNKEK